MDLLDFDVQREAWLYYKLSDESRLKFKLVLTQVAKSRSKVNPTTGEPVYQMISEKLSWLVSFTDRLRKPPSSGNVTKKRLSKSMEEEVSFNLEPNQDVWNTYRLEDEVILQITPVIQRVVRTKLRGLAGEPVYVTTSGQEFKLKVPRAKPN